MELNTCSKKKILTNSNILMNTNPENDNNIKAVNIALDLLKTENIKYIAYIDDNFSIDECKDKFVGIMKSFKNKNRIIKIDSITWDVPIVKFEKDLINLWENSSEEKKKYFLNIVYSNSDGDGVENYSPLIELEKYFKSTLKTYSPEDWKKNYVSLYESLENQDKILCLFDWDYTHSKVPEYIGKKGIDFAKEIMDSDYREKSLCAIFSHLITVEEEFKKKKEWCHEYNIEENSFFYPISKKRLQEDSSIESFVQGIRNLLLVKDVEKLKSESCRIISDTFKKIEKEIENMTPASFNQIVHRSSKIEGAWELDTLFRLGSIIYDYSTKEIVKSKVSEYNTIISEIRKKEEIYDIETEVEGTVKQIEQREIFYSSEIINELHYPLCNGDIFEIGEKEYILLVQPCNLAVRDNGKRSPSFISGILVELKKENSSNVSSKLQCCDKYAHFSSYRAVNLDILDLSVFVNDGRCKINLDSELDHPILFYTPLIKRYKSLKSIFKKCIKTRIALNEAAKQLNGDNKHIIERIKKDPNFSLVKFPNLNMDIVNNSIEFNIKRTKRYKSPYSDCLLDEFTNYLSRYGSPHVLTKQK